MDTNKLIQDAHEFHLTGRFEEAEHAYKEILQNEPENYQIFNDLGNLYQEQGRYDEAVTQYQKSISINPSFAPAYYNLAETYHDCGLAAEAIYCYKKALELEPSLTGAYYNIGVMLNQQKKFDEALDYFNKALQYDPNDAHTYNSIGVVLQERGNYDEALEYFQKAISLDPNIGEVYNNIGSVLTKKGLIEEAFTNYHKALELSPNSPDIHFGYALLLLLTGDFEKGWNEYEWRLLTREIGSIYQNCSQPFWNGSDINGQTILLYTEQGLGDVIHFIRYAKLLAQRGAKVIVDCQKELSSLIKNADGVDEIFNPWSILHKFDVSCPLLSLPRIFNTTLESIPVQIPYIRTDPLKVKQWKKKIKRTKLKKKVGLVWAGEPKNLSDRYRSTTLQTFLPLSKIKNVVFYSLQKGSGSEQAKNPPKGMKLIDLMDEVQDFSDTAAIIENLDLVISVDTAVAHLAGALGKPVWTLLPFAPDWRWMLNREDSPWYPTMRLFRQPSLGDWETVIDKVVNELNSIIQKGEIASSLRSSQ